jgi:K+-transporting ATPase KdpF subunit
MCCTSPLPSWDSPRSGQSLGPASASEVVMFDYALSLIVSLLLLVYLGWAMFKPERF